MVKLELTTNTQLILKAIIINLQRFCSTLFKYTSFFILQNNMREYKTKKFNSVKKKMS